MCHVSGRCFGECLEALFGQDRVVRNDDQADIVAARGATPMVVDLYDRAAVVGVFGDADAAIHTASPGDATSADLDSAVVDAATDAYAGTGKAYIEISGTWVYGTNPSISEESPFQGAGPGGVEGSDRTPSAWREGHARSGRRVWHRIR
jgi:hypothetical protein